MIAAPKIELSDILLETREYGPDDLHALLCIDPTVTRNAILRRDMHGPHSHAGTIPGDRVVRWIEAKAIPWTLTEVGIARYNTLHPPEPEPEPVPVVSKGAVEDARAAAGEATKAVEDIFGKVTALDAEISRIREKIQEAEKQAAATRAESFLQSGELKPAKAAPATDLERQLMDLQQVRGALSAKWADAVDAQTAAKRTLASLEADAAKVVIAGMRKSIDKMRDALAAQESEIRRMQSEASKQAATVEALGAEPCAVRFIVGDLETLRQKADDPACVIDRGTLADLLDRWQRGFKPVGFTMPIRVLEGCIFYGRNGAILETTILKAGSMDSGYLARENDPAIPAFRFRPAQHAATLARTITT